MKTTLRKLFDAMSYPLPPRSTNLQRTRPILELLEDRIALNNQWGIDHPALAVPVVKALSNEVAVAASTSRMDSTIRISAPAAPLAIIQATPAVIVSRAGFGSYQVTIGFYFESVNLFAGYQAARVDTTSYAKSAPSAPVTKPTQPTLQDTPRTAPAAELPAAPQVAATQDAVTANKPAVQQNTVTPVAQPSGPSQVAVTTQSADDLSSLASLAGATDVFGIGFGFRNDPSNLASRLSSTPNEVFAPLNVSPLTPFFTPLSANVDAGTPVSLLSGGYFLADPTQLTDEGQPGRPPVPAPIRDQAPEISLLEMISPAKLPAANAAPTVQWIELNDKVGADSLSGIDREHELHVLATLAFVLTGANLPASKDKEEEERRRRRLTA